MLKKEFIEMMKNDEELQQLRRQVYETTGKLADVSYPIGKYTLEEWKEQLRGVLKKHESTNQ